MRTFRSTSVALAVTLALLASTCGGADARAARHGADAMTSHPTLARKVVLRVQTGGGFVAREFHLRSVPQFTLYGDGTVLEDAPQPAIFPGPALHPLLTFHLDEHGIQTVLSRARRAGLLGRRPPSFGMPRISDLPSTSIVIHADGHRRVYTIYALEAGTSATLGVTAAQARARRGLNAFIAHLPDGGRRATPWTPTRLEVFVEPLQGPFDAGATPVTWPLSSDLATAGTSSPDWPDLRCIAVTGDDGPLLLSALRPATESAPWRAHDGARPAWRLVARSILPDERPCTPHLP